MIDKVVQKTVIYNTSVQFLGQIASVLLSLVSVGLLTRYLGQSGYGNYTLVFTYLSFFSLIADIGFNVTLVREFSRSKNISQNVKATFLNLKLILILASTLLSVVVLLFFPYSSHIKVAIVIGAVAVAFSNMISYGTSILQSRLRLDLVALIEFATKIITVVAVIYFVYTKAHFYYIISSILLGNLTGFVITIYLTRDFLVLKLSIDRTILRKLFKIALPLGVTSVLSLLYFKVDTLMLSVMKTPYDVGIYGLAYNVLENILMLWGLFMASIFPLLSQYHGDKDVSRYKDLLKKTLLLLVVMSIGIIFFGNVFDYLIMRILGGSKFFASMLPLKILLIAVPFLFLNNVFYSVIISFGKTKFLIVPYLLALSVNILMNLYAIPRFGYIGTSATTVITEVFTSLTYVVIFISYFKSEIFQFLK